MFSELFYQLFSTIGALCLMLSDSVPGPAMLMLLTITSP
jgi:hypothetical protein